MSIKRGATETGQGAPAIPTVEASASTPETLTTRIKDRSAGTMPANTMATWQQQTLLHRQGFQVTAAAHLQGSQERLQLLSSFLLFLQELCHITLARQQRFKAGSHLWQQMLKCGCHVSTSSMSSVSSAGNKVLLDVAMISRHPGSRHQLHTLCCQTSGPGP